MGRASKWLKGLLGLNNKDNNKNVKKQSENLKCENGVSTEKEFEKKRWSFCKSGKGSDYSGEMNHIPVSTPAVSVSDGVWLRSYMSETEKEQSKHAIAVAAASAAAADAAVAAAQAAVAVVRLTNSSHGRGTKFNERWAALKIQIHFRGYLARKALRALKGLVKLQAVVRGYLVRKRAAATLHSMQALFRAQCSARPQRARLSVSTPDFRGRRSAHGRFDEPRNDYQYSRRFSASHEVPPFNNSFEDNPRIVEIDTFNKPRSRSRRIRSSVPQTMSNYYSEEYPYPPLSSPDLPLPANPKKFQDFEWAFTGDDYRFTTAQSTPRLTNPIRSNVLATPARSVCGDAVFRPYSNYPSYMANTQSFKAKQRSHSAPKQRPEPGPKKRLSLNELMASRTSFSGVKMQRSSSHVQETFNCI